MRIGITGTHGLVGAALLAMWQSRHELVPIVHSRTSARGEKVSWNFEERNFDSEPCDGLDAFIHLAGENIATGRWTKAKKERIRESRVAGTRFLAERLARLAKPPKVFVSASAVGYYGNRGDEILTEESAAGNGFLAEVCVGWEESAQVLEKSGVRVVNLRIGVVLSKKGGALAKMLPPFRMGVGGVIGSGTQYMSCVALDDLVSIIDRSVRDEKMNGPVNAVCPEPVTNADFTRALGLVLSRPTIFPMPAVAARIVFGEMADALLLSSARVLPAKLSAAGFSFKCPTALSALRFAITGNS